MADDAGPDYGVGDAGQHTSPQATDSGRRMRLSASPLPYTKALSVSTGTQAASDCWVTGSLSRNGKGQSFASFLVGAFYHITINCYMFAVLLALVTCI